MHKALAIPLWFQAVTFRGETSCLDPIFFSLFFFLISRPRSRVWVR